MRRTAKTGLLAVCALALVIVSDLQSDHRAIADTQPWLPVSKSTLLARLLEPGASPLKIETFDELLAQARANPKIAPKQLQSLEAERRDLALNFAPDDTAWIVSSPDFGLIFAMAGRGDQVHSIRVFIPTVGPHATEKNWNTVQSLFTLAIPNVPDISALIGESLKAAWDKSPLTTGTTPANFNDVIFRKKIGATTLAAFGVPPDLIVYIVTVRDRCIPDANKVNIIQRLVC